MNELLIVEHFSFLSSENETYTLEKLEVYVCGWKYVLTCVFKYISTFVPAPWMTMKGSIWILWRFCKWESSGTEEEAECSSHLLQSMLMCEEKTFFIIESLICLQVMESFSTSTVSSRSLWVMAAPPEKRCPKISLSLSDSLSLSLILALTLTLTL